MKIVFARRTTLVCLVLTFALNASGVAAAAAAPAPDTPLAPASPSVAQDFSCASITPAAITAPTVPPHRPSLLVPLYVSLATLQALDVASTWKALENGGAEANPIMRAVIGSPAGAIALKAGFTGLAIVTSEKLWKKKRAAAILMMIAINGAYAGIVAHNYSVVR